MTTLESAPTATTDAEPDSRGSDAVAERMLQIANDGAICALASIGHELGLFDVLAGLPPVTSVQLADAAGLDERYVREWLGGIASAGFVTYEPSARTYALRPDHTAFLTGTSPDNMTRMMRYDALMGLVQPKVVRAFREGGGLSYDDYPGFHAIQADESAAVNDRSLVDTIIPVAGVTDRLGAGIDVADVGCGRGHAINLLARAFPQSRFWGLDFSAEAITDARAEAKAWGLRNATFVACDVASPVSEPGSYDLVTAFDSIHDQAHPATVLANVHASLRPGGTFLMVDINASSNLEDNLDLPWASFLYMISTSHCMSVSLAQGGDGLGTVWGVQTAERMLHEAGFSDVVVHELDDDPFNAYFVART